MVSSCPLSTSQGPFGDVAALFVTHLHSDHVVGIPYVWLTGWLLDRKTAFRVRGPSGRRGMISYLEQAFQFDIRTRRDMHEPLPGSGAAILTDNID